MGRVAVDGTKLLANASRHKAMSYDRLVDREAAVAAEVDRLQELIAQMLRDAEDTDTAEDDRFGADGAESDLPGELALRQTRLAKMRATKQDLQREAAYSAHSLRAGFVTYAHLRGASDRAIAHQTRHRSLATLGTYVRIHEAWADNAATQLGL